MGLQYLKDELANLIAVNEKFGKWEDELSEYIKGGKLLSIKLFEMLKKAAETRQVSYEILELANAVTDTNAAFFDTANNFI